MAHVFRRVGVGLGVQFATSPPGAEQKGTTSLIATNDARTLGPVGW